MGATKYDALSSLKALSLLVLMSLSSLLFAGWLTPSGVLQKSAYQVLDDKENLYLTLSFVMDGAMQIGWGNAASPTNSIYALHKTKLIEHIPSTFQFSPQYKGLQTDVYLAILLTAINQGEGKKNNELINFLDYFFEHFTIQSLPTISSDNQTYTLALSNSLEHISISFTNISDTQIEVTITGIEGVVTFLINRPNEEVTFLSKKYNPNDEGENEDDQEPPSSGASGGSGSEGCLSYLSCWFSGSSSDQESTTYQNYGSTQNTNQRSAILSLTKNNQANAVNLLTLNSAATVDVQRIKIFRQTVDCISIY